MVVREVPPDRVIEHASALVDELDELWIIEDMEWSGGVAQATMLLERLPRITVGHGIAPAPFRHPVALAMEWAVLARAYPGRFSGGIGHGVQEWMPQLGLAVGSPLTLLEETASVVRDLLAGERVEMRGRYVTAEGVALKFPPSNPPPVSLGVRGPKSLELAGRCADGTVLAEWSAPAYVRWARQRIADGAAAAGRDAASHHVTVFCGIHVAGTTDDARAATRATAEAVRGRPEVMRMAMPDRDPDAPPPSTGDLLTAAAAVGDANHVIHHIRALADAGADTVILVPFGDDPATVLQRAIPTVAGAVRV